MTGIEAEILETFLSELKAVEDVPDALTDQLGKMLTADRLPKPDQLAGLYADHSGKAQQ